jgi:hypothetical protein
VSGGLGVPDETGDRNVDATQIQYAGTARERGKALALQKISPAGAGGRERIGFVLETGNQDLH